MSGQLPAPLRHRRARPIVRPVSLLLTAIDRRLVRRGRRSIGGRVAGHRPVLLLTTTGRRTGRPRTTPLLYAWVRPDVVLLVAANGAADWRPAWLLNLCEDPRVAVAIEGDHRHGTARVLTGSERSERWRDALGAFPTLARAQQATPRAIDLVEVALTPTC